LDAGVAAGAVPDPDTRHRRCLCLQRAPLHRLLRPGGRGHADRAFRRLRQRGDDHQLHLCSGISGSVLSARNKGQAAAGEHLEGHASDAIFAKRPPSKGRVPFTHDNFCRILAAQVHEIVATEQDASPNINTLTTERTAHMASLPKVGLILTGGTIDSVGKDRLDLAWYIETGKRLDKGELLAQLPELKDIADVEEIPFRRL